MYSMTSTASRDKLSAQEKSPVMEYGFRDGRLDFSMNKNSLLSEEAIENLLGDFSQGQITSVALPESLEEIPKGLRNITTLRKIIVPQFGGDLSKLVGTWNKYLRERPERRLGIKLRGLSYHHWGTLRMRGSVDLTNSKDPTISFVGGRGAETNYHAAVYRCHDGCLDLSASDPCSLDADIMKDILGRMEKKNRPERQKEGITSILLPHQVEESVAMQGIRDVIAGYNERLGVKIETKFANQATQVIVAEPAFEKVPDKWDEAIRKAEGFVALAISEGLGGEDVRRRSEDLLRGIEACKDGSSCSRQSMNRLGECVLAFILLCRDEKSIDDPQGINAEYLQGRVRETWGHDAPFADLIKVISNDFGLSKLHKALRAGEGAQAGTQDLFYAALVPRYLRMLRVIQKERYGRGTFWSELPNSGTRRAEASSAEMTVPSLCDLGAMNGEVRKKFEKYGIGSYEGLLGVVSFRSALVRSILSGQYADTFRPMKLSDRMGRSQLFTALRVDKDQNGHLFMQSRGVLLDAIEKLRPPDKEEAINWVHALFLSKKSPCLVYEGINIFDERLKLSGPSSDLLKKISQEFPDFLGNRPRNMKSGPQIVFDFMKNYFDDKSRDDVMWSILGALWSELSLQHKYDERLKPAFKSSLVMARLIKALENQKDDSFRQDCKDLGQLKDSGCTRGEVWERWKIMVNMRIHPENRYIRREPNIESMNGILNLESIDIFGWNDYKYYFEEMARAQPRDGRQIVDIRLGLFDGSPRIPEGLFAIKTISRITIDDKRVRKNTATLDLSGWQPGEASPQLEVEWKSMASLTREQVQVHADVELASVSGGICRLQARARKPSRPESADLNQKQPGPEIIDMTRLNIPTISISRPGSNPVNSRTIEKEQLTVSADPKKAASVQSLDPSKGQLPPQKPVELKPIGLKTDSPKIQAREVVPGNPRIQPQPDSRISEQPTVLANSRKKALSLQEIKDKFLTMPRDDAVDWIFSEEVQADEILTPEERLELNDFVSGHL